jgi:hypothetical protein
MILFILNYNCCRARRELKIKFERQKQWQSQHYQMVKQAARLRAEAEYNRYQQKVNEYLTVMNQNYCRDQVSHLDEIFDTHHVTIV